MTTDEHILSDIENDFLTSLITKEASGFKKTKTVEPVKAKTFKEMEEQENFKSFFKTFGKQKDNPDFLFRVYKDEDWAEEIRQFIPQKDDDYVPQIKELYLLLSGMQQGDNVLLYGPTGAGKTTMISYACSVIRQPFIRCLGRGDLESGPIWGQLSVEGDSTKWNNGIITEGALHGAVILWDEPFVCPPEIQIGAHSLLEDNPTLILTDKPGTLKDKMVIPDDRMRIIYADNTGGLGDEMGAHAGVQVQNTATLDRFQTIVKLDYLEEQHETAILKKKVPNLENLEDKNFTKKLLKFARLVRTNYVDGQLSLTMSPRSLVSVAKKCVFYEGDVEKAMNQGFFMKFSDKEEQGTVKVHMKTCFGDF